MIQHPLNAPEAAERLKNLRELVSAPGFKRPEGAPEFVNNHIHTTYSFSPYSPTLAAYMAFQAGLKSAGIMDHDSVAGAMEFVEAGKILNLAVTVGVECRVDCSKTKLAGKFINHPDQPSCAYVALHGIPHTAIPQIQGYFLPFIQARRKRNMAMVERLNKLLGKHDIFIDYTKDVESMSEVLKGGTVTERHILFAASKAIIDAVGTGSMLAQFVEQNLNIPLSSKIREYLTIIGNPNLAYDLLGALKGGFTAAIYIDATDECPDISELAPLCKKTNAILAYAYLGDVEESPTGDKKAQRFEDGFLDLLFDEITRFGFNAITYMPSRNTLPQLQRVQALCKRNGLLEISGEDINSPRQSFVCPALQRPEFSHLVDMTWALIGHENAATADPNAAFFSTETIKQFPYLTERIDHFKNIGVQT